MPGRDRLEQSEVRVKPGLPCAERRGALRTRMGKDRVNLYLVGFTGTGKTTVGRQVARQLGMDFLDSDHEVERASGRTVTEIFAQDGEPGFRAREREFVERGHPERGCIVACGGGLIVPPGVLDLVRARGVVICLHASLETIVERTARSQHRPLLDGEDREQKVRALYGPREAIYRQAGTMVLTDRRPLREIVAHVVRLYEREAREWRAPVR